ncbi:hypothetical protein BOTBODRAFT_601698 [Botryobasidium botryosum FD-172 SS1]|uniref:Uncharacterized protein n=1 Tax=Botryobasidium botryosum (strain FD-172 SS1) TaxID=930990 RepID=A0A067MNY7_BOTB1|nr:hypothetical protein BOTBODRAFT_601698 [Botryobasidium botryosum FD-172 SS1]
MLASAKRCSVYAEETGEPRNTAIKKRRLMWRASVVRSSNACDFSHVKSTGCGTHLVSNSERSTPW